MPARTLAPKEWIVRSTLVKEETDKDMETFSYRMPFKNLRKGEHREDNINRRLIRTWKPFLTGCLLKTFERESIEKTISNSSRFDGYK